MDLQEFVKTVLVQIDAAVDDAQKQTNRQVSFSDKGDHRTVEFDIALTAEQGSGSERQAKLKIWQIASVGGELSKSSKNTSVSRVSFGLEISKKTRPEQAEYDAKHGPGAVKAHKPTHKNKFPRD